MKISVVIPLYNKYNTIGRTWHSIMNQTILPDEIIIVNDGSTDGSEKLIEKLNHPLIRLINQSNTGVSVARNKGVEEAKGDWIAFLDADDEWQVEQIATYLKLIEKNPKARLVATSYQDGDANGYKKSIVLNKLKLSETGLFKNYFEVATCSSPPVWTSAACLNRASLLSIGGFPSGIKTGEDLLTWARMAVNFPIAYSLYEGAIFWQDTAHTYDSSPNRIPDPADRVGKKLKELLPQTQKSVTTHLKRYIAHWHKMRASIYLRIGNPNAFEEIFKSLYYNPYNYKLIFYLFLLLFPLKYRNNIFKLLAN